MFVKINRTITKSPTKNYFCLLDFTSKKSENREVELFKTLCPRLSTVIEKRNNISSVENSINLSRLIQYYPYDDGYLITAYNMYSRKSLKGDFLDYNALEVNLNMLKEFMDRYNIDVACSSDIAKHFKSNKTDIINIFDSVFKDSRNIVYMCRPMRIFTNK